MLLVQVGEKYFEVNNQNNLDEFVEGIILNHKLEKTSQNKVTYRFIDPIVKDFHGLIVCLGISHFKVKGYGPNVNEQRMEIIRKEVLKKYQHIREFVFSSNLEIIIVYQDPSRKTSKYNFPFRYIDFHTEVLTADDKGED